MTPKSPTQAKSPSRRSNSTGSGKSSSKSPKTTTKQITLADKDLGELTSEEKELMDMDWDAFKGDVSMKQLINTIDRSIKRRNRLLISDDDDGTKLYEQTRIKI